jgi:ketopantoate reductase
MCRCVHEEIDGGKAGMTEKTMRIAIIGTGGVGGAFGAALAKAGADVSFVALGVQLPPDMQARMEKATGNFPPTMMPSMAIDLVRGNRLELPWLAGKVVALGKELGMPTPVFSTMYAALKLYANGAPQ